MAVKDRVTRFSTDLIESAETEGRREGRSAKQQLDYWARVGRSVTAQHSAARRRIEAALRGDLPMSELTDDEGAVFNAEIDARIDERVSATHFGKVLAARGVTTVALDPDGRLVEYQPDGTQTVVG